MGRTESWTPKLDALAVERFEYHRGRALRFLAAGDLHRARRSARTARQWFTAVPFTRSQT